MDGEGGEDTFGLIWHFKFKYFRLTKMPKQQRTWWSARALSTQMSACMTSKEPHSVVSLTAVDSSRYKSSWSGDYANTWWLRPSQSLGNAMVKQYEKYQTQLQCTCQLHDIWKPHPPWRLCQGETNFHMINTSNVSLHIYYIYIYTWNRGLL